ncbi:MAG: anhydro-N-acetylmuramic acid kinase, partial [Candidatus Acidiferrales bacterium]
MLVLGMMSGTSADGIDAALVRISGAPPSLAAKFEEHFHARFPARVRQAVLRLANGGATTTAELSQLNFLLGEEFA